MSASQTCYWFLSGTNRPLFYADTVSQIVALRRECNLLDVCMLKTGKPSPLYAGKDYSTWWSDCE